MTTLEEALLCYLLDDICLDMAFEVCLLIMFIPLIFYRCLNYFSLIQIHRSIRTEGMTLEELYDMKPFPSSKNTISFLLLLYKRFFNQR
jgi:hypothetical protein